MEVQLIQEPTFPLPSPPTCRICNNPSLRPDVRRSNPIGNAGTPYYICSGNHKGNKGHFITIDDNILAGNLRCDCGFTSRRSSRRDADGEFLSCPIGRCHVMRSAPPESTQSMIDVDMMDWTSTYKCLLIYQCYKLSLLCCFYLIVE